MSLSHKCDRENDDVDKMKEMQKAMEKGFKLATGAWGQELLGICQDTLMQLIN